MRTPLAIAAAFILSACTVVVHPGPTGSTSPTPAPVRVSEPVTPLEVTLARPVNGRLLVQTNRPAYVAVFEIVPGHGVALMQPASARQRSATYTGMTWIPATWMTERAARTTTRDRRGPAVRAPAPRARYIYALASDRPLSIPDEAFQSNGMQTLLGVSAYNASSPAVTMRTIARGFVPRVRDEAWAEDAVLISASYEERPTTTVRVYCGRGTVYRVSADIADRVWCPSTAERTRPASPDSVLHDNGRRVQRRPAQPPGGSRGVDRVATLPVDEDERPGNGVGRPDDRGVGRPDDRNDNGRKLGHTDPTKPGGGRPTETGRPEQAGRETTPADTSAKPAKPDTKESKPETKESKPEIRESPGQEQKPDDKGKPAEKGKPDEKAKPDSTASEKPDSSRARPPGRSRRP